jgi:hypothetical protein
MLILLLVSFVVGIGHLFVLRFQTGDIYPAYSSLRSDPLGTRVFYESLENLDDINIRRNHYFLHSLNFDTGTTFFYVGIPAEGYDMVSAELIKVFDRLTQAGGRLVLTFLPPDKNDIESNPEGKSELPAAENVASEKEEKDNSLVSIRNHWGIGFEFNDDLPIEGGEHPALNAVTIRQGFPPLISCHTNFYFSHLDPDWQVHYSSDGKPVIVERRFGKGTIVLCADSYFISNEAMRSERYPRLLVWLMGGNSKIIFDETHFGIHKQPSVATLLRGYRFHGVLLVLAVMALVYVWKNAPFFVPPGRDDLLSGPGVVSEKDYPQGLIAMLRRNIPGGEILQVCCREWQRAFKKDRRIHPGAYERVKEIIRSPSFSSKKGLDAVKGYRQVCKEILKDKKI